MSNFAYLRDVEYAPPDSNFSGLLAKSEFLNAIGRIEPKVVDDLFSSSWKAFIKATKHKEKILDEDTVVVEYINFIGLVNEDYVTKHEVLPDSSFVRVPLFELQNDFAELHKCLLDWGEKYNLKADWCYDFGKNVLVDFWRKTIDRKSVYVLLEEKEKKATESLVAMFTETLTKQKSQRITLPPITPQSDRLTHFMGESLRDIADARIAPAQDKEPTQEIEYKTYHSPEKYKNVVCFAAGISCEFHFDSWEKIANEILKDARSQLIVPEHRFENNYYYPGNLLHTFKLKPDHLCLQPPKPPDGLPSIASWEPGQVSLTSKKMYMEIVRIDVMSCMLRGITRQLPSKVRKEIVSQIYTEIKPKADRYWEEYAKYLVSQGWRKTTRKRQLKQHCEWLVRDVVCRDKQVVIATSVVANSKGRSPSHQAVSKAVNEIAKVIELPLNRRSDNAT